MTAFNIVRFRVKSGREKEFIAAHRKALRGLVGFRRGALVKTGGPTYCFVGEWTSYQKIATARPMMISLLDSFRDCLEDLGSGLGVTDPVSGEVVMEVQQAPKSKPKPREAAKTKRQNKSVRKRSAKKTARKKPTRR